MNLPILTLSIGTEADVVIARQRARHLSAKIGFDVQDQTRIATAVSEIARNALTHGRGGMIEFSIEDRIPRQMLAVNIRDHGPGIVDLDAVLEGRSRAPGGLGVGLMGTRRLVDRFGMTSEVGKGTTVRFAKSFPLGTEVEISGIAALTEGLVSSEINPFSEIESQNRELLSSLEELRLRQEELGRMNTELEDTNRGVVALYAELDDRAEKLRGASELKSRFLSNMSHEFRTPLNSILALARLLLERTDGDLTQEQERQVTYISQSAENLTQLVNDLLDIAKVEAGKVQLRPSSFTIASLFGSLRGVLRPLQTNDLVDLIFVDSDQLPHLFTDEGKVAQILRNLVSNSIKFTERGEVRITAEFDAKSGHISFAVSDTGIGISVENQPLIFQEFAQVENDFQTKVKGTGLGLPLSRKLAELLGGDLIVQSELGLGSIFTLTIPVRLGNSTLNAPSGQARRVLIIDDEETSRYLLRQLLISSGPFDVVEATNGKEGLAKVRRETFDLILLDLRMPELDGYGVLSQLAADSSLRNIPVVICSSSVLDGRDIERLTHAVTVLSKANLSKETFASTLASIPGILGPVA